MLEYDQFRYEFYLNGAYAPIDVVRMLDARGSIRWRALEQRDWMLRVNAADLEACRQRSLDLRVVGEGRELSPEQQVLADAARDDGVLAGKLVEADPALVQAIADELERRGFGAKAVGAAGEGSGSGGSGGGNASGGSGDGGGGNNATATAATGGAGNASGNPLAAMDLPRGMEALGQMERALGDKRDMTRQERRLMKRILKNDDKAKAKREREAVRLAAVAVSSDQADSDD